MTAEDVLSALRDIRPPEEPPWWYLSPVEMGLGLTVILASGLFWLWRRRRRSNRLVHRARSELGKIAARHEIHRDDRKFAEALAHWLKTVAMAAFPERQLESVTGSSWLRFLDQSLEQDHFSRGAGRVFGGAVYRADVDFEPEQALALCRRWLVAVTPRLRHLGQGRC